MVAAVRKGQSHRAVAAQFGIGVATVALRVERAKGQRLDRIDWFDRPCAPHRTKRTEASLEDLALNARSDLAQGDLEMFFPHRNPVAGDHRERAASCGVDHRRSDRLEAADWENRNWCKKSGTSSQ